MAIQLTSLLQHANTVAGSGHGDQPIYIKQDGSISKDSGLAHIRRPSDDQKKAENQASLEAFKQALIEDNPLYESLLSGEGANQDLAKFFTTKQAQGTPLTAKDVQTVKGMLDMAQATSIGKMLVGADMLHGMDATSFAWFCVGKSLSLNSTENIRDALKQFYTENYCRHTVGKALEASGMPKEAIGPATEMLLKSATFKEAMNKAFAPDLTNVTWETIIKALGQELGPACKTMVDLIKSKPDEAQNLFAELAGFRGKEGVAFFDGFMKLVQGGGLPEEDKVAFFHQCRSEHTDLSTPEAQSSALRLFLVDKHSGKIMEDFAVSNGLPEVVGKNLAHLPPLKALIQKELSAIVAPPAVPTQAQLEQAIDRAGSIFLAQKGEAIQKILNLAKLTTADVEGNPLLSKLSTQPLEGGQCISEERLLEMMNAMLYADTLLDTLLAPEAGADMELINALRDFQGGTESCQHTVPGTYGGPELMMLSQDALLLMMVSRGATPEDMEKLLHSVDTGLRQVSLGIDSLRKGLMSGKVTSPDRFEILNTLPYLQNSMRRITQFAYDMVSDERKTALGITTDADKFFAELEEIDGTPQPLGKIHQSVRDYAATLGIQLPRVGYKENQALAQSTTDAFTGAGDSPRLTPLFIERATVIARELGLEGLNVADLDPVAIGSLMQRQLQSSGNERLTGAQAQEMAENVIRKVLGEYKATLEFIQSLPTEATEETKGKFIISPEEKTMLLRVIPGSTLRDPELIKAVVLESRSMGIHLTKLLTPGLNAKDMGRSVMDMAALHLDKIGKLPLDGSCEGQRHGAMSVALQLVMGGKNLSPIQARALYDLVSGDEGKLLGGSATGMAIACQMHNEDVGNADMKTAGLLGVVAILDNMRLLLGKSLGLNPEQNPFYYGEIQPQSIPTGVISDMNKAFGLSAKDLPGYEALNQLDPPLDAAQWNALLPMMSMTAKGVENSNKCGIILCMMAANAPELLAARTKAGKELTPAQIWQVVIGGKPPRGLNAENLGETMHRHALVTLVKLGSQTSEIPPEAMEPGVSFSLGEGIPFKKLVAAMTPGGKLTLDDIRFKDSFRLSSLSQYTEDNAYGLTTDFPRRKKDPVTGTPSSISISGNDGFSAAYLHSRIADADNKPGLGVYQAIMTDCRSICKSDLQFMRVMQCLSQASTINMRALAQMLPGQSLDEHGHALVRVTEQPNGDILVEVASGPNIKHLGGSMKILVDPNGKTTVQELSVEFK